MATPYETCEKIRNTTGRMSGSCSLPVAATAAIGGGASTSPPPVRTFEETAYDEPHQGLIRLNQAASLLEKGDSSNKDETKELLLESMNEYLKVARGQREGHGVDRAVVEGARQAARLFVRVEDGIGEALDLVRWCCSVAVDSLRVIATALNADSARLAADEASVAASARSLRLLRALVVGFSSFLRNSQNNNLYSSEVHVRQLEQAVGFTREAINNLLRECSEPTIGKAAARLRGLTAIAAFTRLSRDSSVHKDEYKVLFDAMWKMGQRDIDKLIKCIAVRVKPGEPTAYLQLPHNCIEAVGMLRRLAMAAPEVYPQIVNVFADAVKSMDEPSRGKWGDRPSLKSETVRHCVVACAAHLADRVGRNPDAIRQNAFHNLWTALNECCVMQSGNYVLDKPTPPGSAAEKALTENASVTKTPASRGDAVPSWSSSSSPPKSVPPHSRVGSGVSKNERSAAGKGGATDPRLSGAGDKRARSMQSTPVDGRHAAPLSQGASLAAPPGMTPALATSPQSFVKPHPIGNATTLSAASLLPAIPPVPAERKAYPPLMAAPEEMPIWQEGRTYQVLLGESFERGVGKGHTGGSGHYVHFKYDFVPGRTNLDVPATLRQGSLLSADGAIKMGEERWTGEIEYKSRDAEKARPVCFTGDVSSAPELECVLVFDGSKFVIDRVSVVGGLKYVQDATVPATSAGEAWKLAAAKKKDKANKARRDNKDKKAKKDTEDGAKTVAASGRRKNEGRDKPAEKGEKTSSTAGRGIVVAPANRLSQPLKKSQVEEVRGPSDSTGNGTTPRKDGGDSVLPTAHSSP